MSATVVPPPYNIQVQKATPDDAVVLALLGRVTFAEAFEPFFNDKQGLLEHYETTYSVSEMNRSLQDPNTIFWIARHNQLPVGYAKLKKRSTPGVPLSGRCSELQKIYVLKDYIAAGVGHRLLTALFDELQVLQSDNIWLSVWEENSRAIAFYQKHGFNSIDLNYATVGRDRFRFVTMNKVLRHS